MCLQEDLTPHDALPDLGCEECGRFLSEGTSFIAPPASRVTVSKTLPTIKLVEKNGVLVETLVMNPVERNWCFAPNSIDARVSTLCDCKRCILINF